MDDDEERMSYLEQYTDGEARKIVTGFSNLPASAGYASAIKELERRYGEPEIIANAYVEKVMNWPNIKPEDTKLLDEYSVFLTECLHSVDSVSGLGVLDFSENMKTVVKKLPYHMHDKWRSEVLRLREANVAVLFKHLVLFIQREAKKCRDVVFGRDALKSDKGKTNNR